MNTIPLNSDLANFLETLLWCADGTREGMETDDSKLEGATIHEFSKPFTDAVDKFLSGFRAYAESKGLDPDAPDRSFGGNVYFSLSGHGCGFWDDRGEEGDKLQSALIEFSGGNRYRFEALDSELRKDEETGEIDLCILPAFIGEYRRKRFSDGVQFLPE